MLTGADGLGILSENEDGVAKESNSKYRDSGPSSALVMGGSL